MFPIGCQYYKVQTTKVVYGTVWPKFAMQVVTRCCDPHFGRKMWSYWGWGWFPGSYSKVNFNRILYSKQPGITRPGKSEAEVKAETR